MTKRPLRAFHGRIANGCTATPNPETIRNYAAPDGNGVLHKPVYLLPITRPAIVKHWEWMPAKEEGRIYGIRVQDDGMELVDKRDVRRREPSVEGLSVMIHELNCRVDDAGAPPQH